MAKAVDPNAKSSHTSTNLVSNMNAVKILRRKIKFLVEIFENSEPVRQNPEFARRLNQIVC